MSKRRFGLIFILNLMLVLSFMLAMTVLFVVYGLTISDIFAAILAFFPTGWAFLLVSLVLFIFFSFPFLFFTKLVFKFVVEVRFVDMLK